MTCDDLAKKCKAGDKKACELYKKKCGKVGIFSNCDCYFFVDIKIQLITLGN